MLIMILLTFNERRRKMRRIILPVILSFLLGCVLLSELGILPARTEPSEIIVPDDYLTIQEAINHAKDEDTVFVRSGAYYENVVVNKSISLIGEDRRTTIIDGNYDGNVLDITASSVRISDFTIQHSGSDSYPYLNSCGIYIGELSTGNDLVSNIIRNNTLGIGLLNSHNNNISSNHIENNTYYGIRLFYLSNDNYISANNIFDSCGAIFLEESSSNNIIFENALSDHKYGILLWLFSNDNRIYENNIRANDKGMDLWMSSNNTIYHNNFIGNAEQVHSINSTNSWDSGIEGNYWSDYTDSDSDFNGIGDSPYLVDGNNSDNYPLMNQYWNPADINHNLRVDIQDLARTSAAFGSYPGHPKWNPHCDITGPEYLVPDGVIDIMDVALVSANFGKYYRQ